jgi:hypothetical protein
MAWLERSCAGRGGAACTATARGAGGSWWTTTCSVAPAAITTAAVQASAFKPTPPTGAAAPEPSVHESSEAGNGSAPPKRRSAPERARALRANVAHSSQARRWARSAARSARELAPSSWREIARAASPQLKLDSSCSRIPRRARNSNVSTALTDTPSASAISAWLRPSSSRMTSADRCVNGRLWSARAMSLALGASVSSSTAYASWSSTSRGRRAAWRNRCRQTLWAIANSQLRGERGRLPSCSARYAFRNVVCVTSSASADEPSTPSAYPYTSRTWRE